MNRWGYQQKTFVRGYALDGVICPMPRKIGVPLQFQEQTRMTSRLLHISNQQTEACDAKAGTELLDIIRMKGSCICEKSSFSVASSPPYFTGSPPSRASNPLIQDEIFCNNNGYPTSPMFEAPSTTRRNGGYVGSKFGPKPAAVRIEGFNCSGDSRISAVA